MTGDPRNDAEQDDRGNWAGTHTFTAQRIEHPETVAEVVRLVRESEHVHALSGSFERDTFAIAFTFLRRPEEVSALLPDVEGALRPRTCDDSGCGDPGSRRARRS